MRNFVNKPQTRFHMLRSKAEVAGVWMGKTQNRAQRKGYNRKRENSSLAEVTLYPKHKNWPLQQLAPPVCNKGLF